MGVARVLLTRHWPCCDKMQLLILCGLFAVVTCTPFSNEWSSFVDYMQEYKKPYKNDSTITIKKFEAFKLSLVRHQTLNLVESQRKGTAVYGVNKFSDLTQDEFKSIYLSNPRSPTVNGRISKPSIGLTDTDTPMTFDWRKWNNQNVLTSINNQKYCGSCWAFSVIETIESAVSILTKTKPNKLSVQQLISCANIPGKLDGCQGGEIISAFNYLANSSRIVGDRYYPFSSSDGRTGTCKTNLPNTGVMLEDFVSKYNIHEESDMTSLVSQVSPTSNAVNAVMWQDYKAGIIQHHCDQSVLDHAVQVVGYSLENDPIPYWIVRNTWGSDWGEDGFVRLSLGHNTCGVASEVVAVTKATTNT